MAIRMDSSKPTWIRNDDKCRVTHARTGRPESRYFGCTDPCCPQSKSNAVLVLCSEAGRCE